MPTTTKSPTSATGSGWTTPDNFDGSTSGAATYAIAPEDVSTILVGANLGFDSAIPAGATITQVRCRIYWNSSSCSADGIELSFWLAVSGTLKGGTGVAACTETAGWTSWYTCTDSWTRGNLLDGVLTLRLNGLNLNTSASRTLYAWAGEVEVTYTAGGVQVMVLGSP
jgi:hypothetical protein